MRTCKPVLSSQLLSRKLELRMADAVNVWSLFSKGFIVPLPQVCNAGQPENGKARPLVNPIISVTS